MIAAGNVCHAHTILGSGMWNFGILMENTPAAKKDKSISTVASSESLTADQS